MTLDELRVEAAWLQRCSWECPWPIVTALDLSEFAHNIIDNPPDDLSVGELRRIEELIERLKPLVTPPEQLAREAKAEEGRKKRFGDLTSLESPFNLLEEKEEKWRRWQLAGACARAKKSKRKDIISHWQKLSHLPPRDRASAVAVKLGLTSPTCVGWFEQPGFAQQKNGPIRFRLFRLSRYIKWPHTSGGDGASLNASGRTPPS